MCSAYCGNGELSSLISDSPSLPPQAFSESLEAAAAADSSVTVWAIVGSILGFVVLAGAVFSLQRYKLCRPDRTFLSVGATITSVRLEHSAIEVVSQADEDDSEHDTPRVSPQPELYDVKVVDPSDDPRQVSMGWVLRQESRKLRV
jgi:hypothetical protein